MSTLQPNAIPDIAPSQRIGAETDEQHEIHALGYWESVWRVFKRDKVAIAGGITIVLLILASFVGAPVAQHFLGHDANTPFLGGTTAANGAPIGPMARVTQLPAGQGQKAFFVLGADSLVGRDEFLRLLWGGQTSLEIAVFATVFSTLMGLLLGAAAGYFGGVIDVIISRITELVMAFPLLLFVIGLSAVAGPQLRGITFGFLPPGVVLLTAVFSIFGWFYPARIARAQILSLREKEFVEAARMTGASDWRIIRSHLLPHLVAPMIVISTLSVGGFVLGEAGLSFLGIGITDPTSSWGQLLELSVSYYRLNVYLLLWPGLMVLITTLAFNLLGDGLRDAFDPRTAN
jgi:peptide/nickel transport system permease protein